MLIIENLDRLSRTAVKKAQKIFEKILEASVWICTKTPFRIYKDDDSADFIGLLEPLWIMYCAYMESLKKSQRIADLWTRDRQLARDRHTPISPAPPFWLSKTSTGYVLNNRLPILREIAQLSIAYDLGASQICARMEAAGTPSPFRSGRWHEETVRRILRDRALIGEYQPCRRIEDKPVPDGPPIPNYYPPALTPEEFAELQRAITRRQHRRGRPGTAATNLFTGLVFDAVSRERLALRGSHVRGKKYLYLSRAQRHGEFIDYSQFEEAVLRTIATLRPADIMDRPEEITERLDRIKALTTQFVALEQRQHDLQAAAADPTRDLASLVPVLDQVGRELKAVAGERDRLKEESRSGRVEVLTETQTLAQYRQEKQGDERRDLDARIRAILPTVISSIWTQAQRVGPRAQITHVQIHLQSGQRRYVQLFPRHFPSVAPWDLQNWDLREKPYVATKAEKSLQTIR